ncbi:MAG TPA: hypothetical protein VHZ75_05755 [Solirubrobacteraceae bacterium]|jgi:hypothetical protein|nr:hypothetical protein [Solirubrobacteraceae bacterium]
MRATSRPASDAAPAKPSLIDPANGIVWRIVLVLLLVGTAVLMFSLTRGLTFNLDEWTVVTQRRGAGAPSLLAPHNEHLSLLLLIVYLGLLKIGGLNSYWLQMVPLVALQLTLGWLLFVVARRRVGAGVAVSVAAFALLCGYAYENFLIPGQEGQMGSIVAGVAAFAVLDLARTRRTDLALAGLMLTGLLCSGMGIPVLVGITLELALTADGRQRLWVVAAPFALYLLWYVGYGTNRAELSELTLSVVWAWTAACQAAGAIIGERQIEPGQELLLLMLALLAYRVFKVPPAARVRLAALTTILVIFYGLTAISRHDIAPPSSSRYLTVGVVFMLLMLVEGARGWRIRVWVPFVVLALAWVSFAKADGNAKAIRDGRTLFLQRSDRVRASLGAVDLLGRDRVPPTLEIAPLAAPFLEAGPWFGALDGLRGNPADSPAEIEHAPPDVRAYADDTLLRAGGLALRPAPAWAAARAAGCVRLAGTTTIVPPGGLRVQAGAKQPLTLRARRFGTDWQMVGVLPIPPRLTVELHPLRDAAPVPYRIQAPGATRICRLGE